MILANFGNKWNINGLCSVTKLTRENEEPFEPKFKQSFVILNSILCYIFKSIKRFEL